MQDKPHIILIVEDEKSIREVLQLNLSLDGYEVMLAENGLDAIKFIKAHNVHIILMDVMLPKLNGIEASRRIKLIRPDLPIIMLSALDQSCDRIKGLKAGADDYINKPFNYEELLLRIEKQLQKTRKQIGNLEEIKIGDNLINLVSYTLKNSKASYRLNSIEISLIKYLYINRNRVISREELFANVWGYDSFPNSRTVDNYISSLRKYLEKAKDQREYIHSERGIGYKLILEQN